MDINLVSSSDFRKNQKKYLELAKRERVIITQRGTNDIFELVRVKKIEKNNLQTAITAEELLSGIEADIREIYRKKVK
jgi:CO dehydrogenase/acetyl-CoA synthase epsilon subunit